MTWTQIYDPMGSLALSALMAAIPMIIIFYLLAIRRAPGQIAGGAAVASAVLVAVLVYKMPVATALTATVMGAFYGVFPIFWIVITAIFIYNMTVETGQFEIIKNSIASITDDRRLQALLIAFAFGAFLEGAAGFGTPVAISAGMLVGLGFNPLYAAGLCLIANTAPVAFGGIGIPIIVAGQVTGIETMKISQMVGRQLPFLSVIIPIWLVVLMSGWKSTMEVLPACLVAGISFATLQWFSSNYIGPELPDILSALAAMISLALFLKIWKPAKTWRFADEKAAATSMANVPKYSAGTIFKAWSPFIVLTVMVILWGLKPVQAVIDAVSIKILVPGLDKVVMQVAPIAKQPTAMAALYKINWMSAAGTALFIASIISAMILGVGPSRFVSLFAKTFKQLTKPLITIPCVLGLAYIMNYSGMSSTLGLFLAGTGSFFPFFSAFLGWLGVFLTGSDTSANALFGNLQAVTAQQVGMEPVLAVAANSSGGVTGKMISPQSIAVATAATGLVGKEGDLFSFTVMHSLVLAVIIGLMTYAQAYFLTWMIP
ncbi:MULTISPECIES: L-lactate permease [Sporomusa]|jgi:lactate permease|uniref:L-lactate permease n=2 Tax=Sporomusa TaxID=2375 RepID=A0ABM9W7C5_9FIRM|nr:lactate permease LctP family transporter [Sporomusa sphaeroides]MCM0760712.1 lactate permease LctP family transporter [Sporomusa sphaeroides DSM 2875]OLS57806.1 glycolate permease GlcA [Sporomusa sphaeroides DSM 2875]CVK20979.1 Glycolate permease GlcA [Sporomusa sphaeroides DSM 2875]SCM80818.1 glycolate transporter [uncultured Sporomusa sp.]HML34835.1 lactate permease LctP family transporter [Sporomusa sphaeroides]